MQAHGAVSRSTLSTHVYVWLRDEILAGNVAQGERINEVAIAARLGVSATPVREAIRLLSGDGLVEYSDRKGVRVIELSEREIRQCFAVRRVLERLALREAHAIMTDEEKRAFVLLAERTAEARGQEPRALLRLDRAFHEYFVARADNEWLKDFTQRMHNVLTVARSALYHEPDIERTAAEHRAIARAVASDELDAAERHLDAHIERVCAGAVAAQRRHHDRTGGEGAAERGIA